MAVKLNRLLTQGRHTALVFDVCFLSFFFWTGQQRLFTAYLVIK